MTTGTKVLIGGGVLIVGYVAWNALSGPSKGPTLVKDASSLNPNNNLFTAFGSALGGLIASASGSNPKSGPMQLGSSATTWYSPTQEASNSGEWTTVAGQTTYVGPSGDTYVAPEGGIGPSAYSAPELVAGPDYVFPT